MGGGGPLGKGGSEGPGVSMEVDDNRRRQVIEDIRKSREKDLGEGRERGQQLFNEQEMGYRESALRQADLADIIARRKEALEGLSGNEKSALRDQALESVRLSEQGALRQLRGIQGAQGLRGGLAGAQQASVLSDFARQRAGVERDIYLQDVLDRQNALTQLEQTLGAEQQRAQQSKLGQLSAELGYGSLGAQDRASAMEMLIGEKQFAAASQDSGGKK